MQTDSIMESLTENLTGDTLSLLLAKINKYFNMDGDKKQELTETYEIICQLNLELMNMFDNYLCFSGKEDEAQLLRLTKSATQRARTTLKSSNHLNTVSTETLLKTAARKLSSHYQQENKAIRELEEMYASEVVRQAKEKYRNKFQSYINIDNENLEDVVQKMLHQCITAIDRSLDFSGKMNNIHSRAVDDFENWAKIQHTKEGKQEPNTVSDDVTVAPESEYKRKMDASWEKINTREQLENLHAITKKKLIGQTESKTTSVSSLQMDRYFGHIREMFENKLNDTKTYPVLLLASSNVLKLHVFDRNAHATINNISKSAPSNAIRCFEKDFKYDLFTSISCADKNLMQTSGQMQTMLKIFKWFKQQAEALGYKWVIIPIPSWFGVNSQTALRKLCGDAGFEKVSMCHETALIAHSFFKSQGTSTLCEITICEAGIVVEIYELQNESATKLIGISSFEWPSKSVKNTKTGHLNTLMKHFSSFEFKTSELFSTSSKTSKPKAPHTPYVNILVQTYQTAMKQLSSHQQNKKRYFYLCTLYPTWRDAYFGFLDTVANQNQHKELQPSDLVLRSYQNLINTSAKICETIISHTFVQSSSQHAKVTSNKTSAKRSKGSQHNVLDACKKVREQVDNRTVRLGPLMRKIVLESVQNMEKICSNGEISDVEMLQQSVKLQKLITDHKFNVQL